MACCGLAVCGPSSEADQFSMVVGGLQTSKRPAFWLYSRLLAYCADTQGKRASCWLYTLSLGSSVTSNHVQACANIISHTCISSNGQSGSSMWDAQNRIRAILTGKVGHGMIYPAELKPPLAAYCDVDACASTQPCLSMSCIV